MRMFSKISRTAVLVGGLFMWLPYCLAQDTSSAGQQQPTTGQGQPTNQNETDSGAKPAASGGPVSEAQLVVPDTLPLAGAQNLTLGSPAAGHNILLPSFGVITQIQSNPYNSSQTSSPTVVSSTYLTGRLAMNRTSGSSQLSLDYLAGGSFSTDAVRSSSGIQSLNFSNSHQWGRWTLLVGDHFNYTAQSPFGFGGVGGLGNLGVGLGNSGNPGFRQGFLPGQSIFLNGVPQISNAVVGEVDYASTPRSSLSFAGSYGLLDFVGSSLQNTSNATFQSGWSYLLDRKNSMSLSYRFNDLMFGPAYTGFQGIKDHGVQVSYARRLVGRLSLQVGAGPDIRIFSAPLAGSSRVVSWAAASSLIYQYHYWGAGFSYNHSLTGGSGTFLGATTDLFTGNINRSFGRDWDGGISAGYSRNQALQQTTVGANSIAPQAWFGTLQASRHFVRYGSLFIGFNVSGQSGLASVCSQPACKVNTLSTAVSIGYNWGLRPVVMN